MIKLFKRFYSNKKLFWRYIRREEFFLSFKGLICLLLLIFIVWLAYAVFILLVIPKMEVRGQSGDMFGGITALFSGLAFAGLVYTLFVQKKELQYQREELTRLVDEQAASREQLKNQATHMELQNMQFSKQSFENTFFALLTQFREFKASQAKDGSSGQDQLDTLCQSVIPSSHFFGESRSKQSISPIEEYLSSYESKKADFAPYFRHIYNILKFVDHSGIEDQKVYSNFLRADLNHLELAVLALNAASANGKKKLKPLLKKYDFLKHFDYWQLFEDDAFLPHLKSAYEDFDFLQRRQKAISERSPKADPFV